MIPLWAHEMPFFPKLRKHSTGVWIQRAVYRKENQQFDQKIALTECPIGHFRSIFGSIEKRVFCWMRYWVMVSVVQSVPSFVWTSFRVSYLSFQLSFCSIIICPIWKILAPEVVGGQAASLRFDCTDDSASIWTVLAKVRPTDEREAFFMAM